MENQTRRSFLKKGLKGLSLMLAGTVVGCATIPESKREDFSKINDIMQYTFDIYDPETDIYHIEISYGYEENKAIHLIRPSDLNYKQIEKEYLRRHSKK